MKKMTAWIMTAILIVTVSACSNKKGQSYLNAKVLEISGTEIVAECVYEPNNELTGKTIRVLTNVISANRIPEMEVSKEIRVVFDFNKVNEKNSSVIIEQVYAIYLLDDSGNVIAN